MKKETPVRALERTQVLNCLWGYQRKHGFIREEDVVECSKKLGMSEIELEGVISFYHFFHRQSPGRITIYLNNSIVSETKGFHRVKEAFERETGGAFGSTDPGGQFGLFETACIGLSDHEPAALINFHPFTNLNTLKVRQIIARLKKGEDPGDFCDNIRENIRYKPAPDKTIFFREYLPGATTGKLADIQPETVIRQVRESGLSGRGGAFFATGHKWELCADQPETPKYVVCNADEGEPGTFKDRALLNNLPGLVFEGMIAAGYAIGAREGIVYLRAEYTWMVEALEKTIEQFRKMHLLGKNVAGIEGFDFDIRIQLGAGSYVCGEETAMLNSMEGKRGEPRTREFFPIERGFLDKPTLVNNVETFAAAARIIELGVDYFLNTGLPECPGTKLISVSGDCHQPGIYEIEWGMTVGELLQKAEADDPYFVQVSGPAGECINMTEASRVISRNDLRCGGSFMIFNSRRDLIQIFGSFAEFFKHESCGVCTPCRAGNFIVQQKLQKIESGLASRNDFTELTEWGKIMAMTSRCGLGKTATRSLLMAIEKFPDYFHDKVDHLQEGLSKGFSLDRAVEEYEKFNS